jgi:hypothetical protein
MPVEKGVDYFLLLTINSVGCTIYPEIQDGRLVRSADRKHLFILDDFRENGYKLVQDDKFLETILR